MFLFSGRGKKDDRILQRVYMGFMMAKSVISLLLMFVSPILQVKGLILSLINVIVNAARLVVQFKSYKEQKEQRLSAAVVHLDAYPGAGSHEDVTGWDVYTRAKPDTEWSESYNRYTTEPYRGYQPKSADTGYNWNAQQTQPQNTYQQNVADLIDITANEAKPAFYVHNLTAHLA